MTERHLGKFPNSLSIREMKIKTTLRSSVTSVAIAKIRNTGDNISWQGYQVKRTLLHCWWGCKLSQLLWIPVWLFLRKLENCLFVVHALNPCTWESETEIWLLGHPGLQELVPGQASNLQRKCLEKTKIKKKRKKIRKPPILKPSNATLDMFPMDVHIPQGQVLNCVHSNIICSHPRTCKHPLPWKMGNKIVAYLHSGLLHSG